MKKLLIISFSVLLTSCYSNKATKIEEYLNSLSIPIKNKKSFYLLIPLKSCSTCKDKIFSFLDEGHMNKENINLIILDNSIKSYNNFKERFCSYKNVFHDKSLLAYDKNIIKDYNSFYFMNFNNNSPELIKINFGENLDEIIELMRSNLY